MGVGSAALPCGGGGRAAERLCAGLRGEGSCVQQVAGSRERPAGLGNGAGVSPGFGFNFGDRRPIASQRRLCTGKAARLSRVGRCGVSRQKVGLMCMRQLWVSCLGWSAKPYGGKQDAPLWQHVKFLYCVCTNSAPSVPSPCILNLSKTTLRGETWGGMIIWVASTRSAPLCSVVYLE